MDNKNNRIKDIPQSERPRERLIKYGPEVLSNSELLAILLRTGTKNISAISLAQKIMRDGGIDFLCNSTFEELSSIKGIGIAKAAQIKAAIELGKRLKGLRTNEKVKISSPKDVFELIGQDMRFLKKEQLRLILLNTKNYVIDIKDISIGSLNSSIVHPREVFNEAIRRSSSSIIICHNHPSGDPEPSSEDINITRRLYEVGKLVGIDLLDHIIIGDGSYISLKEKNVF